MNKNKQLYFLIILSIICIPAAYLFVAAVFAINIYKGNNEPLKKIRDKNFLVVFLIYVTTGVVFSSFLPVSALYGAMMILCVYSIGIVDANMEHANIINIKKLIYIVSEIVFLIGLFQYLNSDFAIPQKWVDGDIYQVKKRIYSTFFNPNIFGFYINIVLIIICGSIDMKKADKLEISVLIMGIISLFLTFSRTSWISLIISLVVSGLIFDKKYYKFALFIGAFLISFDKLLNMGRFDISKVPEDSSMLYRIEIWKSCYKIIKNNMVTGIGFGTLFKNISEYSNVVKPNIEHCHNLYIQILTESGIIGFSCFIYILCNVIYVLWIKVRKTQNKEQWVTLSAVITMVMIHSLVDSVLLTPQILMITSIYTGVAMNQYETDYIAVAAKCKKRNTRNILMKM